MIDVAAIFRRKQAAQHTLDDPGMQAAMAEVHRAAMLVIVNSQPGDAALREQAYQTIRTLKLLEQALAAMVAAHTLVQERERKATRS
jgi:hypothetical protein